MNRFGRFLGREIAGDREETRKFLLLGSFVPIIAGSIMVAEENAQRNACLAWFGQFAQAVSNQAATQCQQVETTWTWGLVLVGLGVAGLVAGAFMHLLRTLEPPL